jgi:hypothetical protein
MTNAIAAIAALTVSAFAFIAPAHADCSAQTGVRVYTGATQPTSFGVEREMKESGEKSGSRAVSSYAAEEETKESGEKGGTEDINIGVGELQECTISK